MDRIQEMTGEIVKCSGGPDNILSVRHCMTRLRLDLREESLADTEALKKIRGVLGVVQEGELQIVLGPGIVDKVAGRMSVMTDPVNDRETERVSALKIKPAPGSRHPRLQRVLTGISDIFIPLIPAFIGAGLIGGIAAVFQNMLTAGYLSGAAWTNITLVLTIIKSGMYAFLSIFVGINAAKVFGATPALGGVIGAIIYLPGMTEKNPLINIFTGTPLTAGMGGVIGAILTIWLMSLLEKWLHRHMPEAIDTIVTPAAVLLVIGVLEIFILMPLAEFISVGLSDGVSWILTVGGGFAGFVLAALFLPMVLFGLHQILTPIHIEMITNTGKTLLLPILAMAGAGQIGACIALWIRCRKNRKLCMLIRNSLPVGLLGIAEPLIYGVTLPLFRPFVTACIGGGIGGMVIGLLGNVGATAIGASGLALLPLIADGRWWAYGIGLLSGYAGGFVCTFFFGVPKTAMLPDDEVRLAAPASGKVIPLAEVDDRVFAEKTMGEGIGIEPVSGDVLSPCDGRVTAAVQDTRHAVGIRHASGAEVLIHAGINTVEMGGEGFELFVREGDSVKQGDRLIHFSPEDCLKKGHKATVIMTLTNPEDFKDVKAVSGTDARAGDTPVLRFTGQKRKPS